MNSPIQWNESLARLDDIVVPAPDGQIRLDGLAPASASWLRDVNGNIAFLRFTCPCGCGYVGGCTVGDNGWKWDGNTQKPTFISPSIQMLSPCRWHGFLKNGVFEQG